MVEARTVNDQESMSPEEILKALDQQWSRYPRELIQAAMDRREEVTPLLLAYLRKLVRELNYQPIEVNEFLLPTFSFHLLSFFREAEAHQLIIDLATAPGEISDDLFGGLLTEDLAAFLWMTSAGSDEAIKKLIARDDVDPYVRGQGITALTFGIAEGVLERAEVVHFIQTFFKEDVATDNHAIFLSSAVVCLNDLHPGESMEMIRSAFANGLVDPFWIGIEDIELTSRRPLEEVLSNFLESQRARMAMEPHERMSWWACFRPQEPVSQRFGLTQTRRKAQQSNLTQAQRNKKKAERKKGKNKRKISKASKKK